MSDRQIADSSIAPAPVGAFSPSPVIVRVESWLGLHAPAMRAVEIPKSLDQAKPMADRPIADSSPLRFVLVGTDDILTDRDRIVREPVFIDAVTMRIAVLFIVGAVTFDGALVGVLIVLLFHRHRRHMRLLASQWLS